MLEAVILIMLALGALYGLKKGFISQAASLAGIVLGIAACHLFGDTAARVALGFLPDAVASSPFASYASTILGAMALFTLVGLGVTLAGRTLKIFSRVLLLGPLDHMAGVVIGIAKVAIVLSIIINLWFIVSPPMPENEARYSQGHIVPAVMGIAPHLMGAGQEFHNTHFDNETGEQQDSIE